MLDRLSLVSLHINNIRFVMEVSDVCIGYLQEKVRAFIYANKFATDIDAKPDYFLYFKYCSRPDYSFLIQHHNI